MWKAVRQHTCRRQDVGVVDGNGITAESLNRHYADISTDSTYQQQPPCKLTVSHPDTEIITEWRLFQVFDKLPPTATGMDNLPAWFLRLSAHVFCEPLAYLFNKSLAIRQWFPASGSRPPYKAGAKHCYTSLNHSDYRSISITSVLSRTLERIVVREFLYMTLF